MKIGTTGTSFITDFLIKAFISSGNDVLAVMSRSEERGKELASKYNISKVYTDYEKMLEDEDIDTIYIGLPNKLHYEYALKAIQKHKNVVLEKAFCTSYEDAENLFLEASKNNVYLFEAILNRHLPSVKKLKEDLSLLGKISLVKFNFTKRSRKYDEFLAGKNPSNFSKEMGGGALMDLNVYNIHLALELFGKPQTMHYYPNMVKDVDTSGMAVLNYGNLKAILIAGKDSDAISGMEVMGENGYIYFEDSPSIFHEYTIHLKDETIKRSFDDRDPYYFETNEFKRVIDEKDDEAYLEYQKQTLDVMEVLMELYKAA